MSILRRLRAIGLSIGVLIAAATTHVLSALLLDVQPNDPLTLLSVIVILGGVALTATSLPGRRAARSDPLRSFGSNDA